MPGCGIDAETRYYLPYPPDTANKARLCKSRHYVVTMGELHDFTEHKLHQLMEYAADLERFDIAEQIAEMLDAYLMGEVYIEFVDGWPVQYNFAPNDTGE